jgi:hypothetical protein
MFDALGKGISKQFKEIINLHFADPEEISEKRKQWKRLLDFFSKGLNLIVYFMLVTIIMRVAVILILNPEQGLYEAKKYEKGYEQHKNSLKIDSAAQKAFSMKMDSMIRIKEDSIRLAFSLVKQKDDSLRALQKEIVRMKIVPGESVVVNLTPLPPRKYSSATIKANANSTFELPPEVKLLVTDSSGSIIVRNYGENYSIWKEKFPSTMQIVLMFGVLLLLLWIMKWVMKLLYKFMNLIAPFDILKLIGLYFFMVWIWMTAHHLFEVATLFKVADKITPHVFLF